MSETTVIHVRDMQPGDLYIGRPMPRQRLAGSIWANPYRIGQGGTRDEVIEKYRRYLLNTPALLGRLPELRGKVLACWCAPAGGVTATDPLVCHGQVLAALADATRDDQARQCQDCDSRSDPKAPWSTDSTRPSAYPASGRPCPGSPVDDPR